VRHVYDDGVDFVAWLRFESYRVLRLHITWRRGDDVPGNGGANGGAD
jgi:hypothetical protein